MRAGSNSHRVLVALAKLGKHATSREIMVAAGLELAMRSGFLFGQMRRRGLITYVRSKKGASPNTYTWTLTPLGRKVAADPACLDKFLDEREKRRAKVRYQNWLKSEKIYAVEHAKHVERQKLAGIPQWMIDESLHKIWGEVSGSGVRDRD